MNKFININVFAILLIVITISSCNIDDIEPINKLTEDNVVTNVSSAKALLNAAYIPFREFSTSNFLAGHMLSSGEQDSGFNGFYGDDGFWENNVEDINPIMGPIYSDFYTAINNVNFLIDQLEQGNAEDATEEEKNALLAEAKTIRAFAHFGLLGRWGQYYDLSSEYGIVLKLEPARENQNISRNTVQECYDSIIADLQFGISNGVTSVPHYRFSAVTAKAILSKVYLYTGDFTNAANTALETINNGDGYALETNYGDNFTSSWGQEILFAPYGNDNNGESVYAGYSFGPYQITPSSYFRVLADESDGIPGDGDGAYNSFGYDNRFMFAYDAFAAGPNGNGKYPHQFYAASVNTIVYMRLSEIYLIYAEAEARRSGGDLDEALVKLNDIRNRAGMPVKVLSDQATLLQDIREEKMLELFCETGETMNDLVRYHILGDLEASTIKPTLTSVDKMIIPIPRAARAGNMELSQNPGYPQ